MATGSPARSSISNLEWRDAAEHEAGHMAAAISKEGLPYDVNAEIVVQAKDEHTGYGTLCANRSIQ
jgi:endo-beta-N-acetylglucosaminidase D